MNLDKIQQLISTLAKTAEDNHKIATPVLAVKLSKCLESYPHDNTLGAMSRVIEKMAANNKLFICRSDLKDLYGKLYTRNTKFAQLFKDELGSIEELPTPTVMEHDDSSNVDYKVDSVLSNALASVFDKTIAFKPYSEKLANEAKSILSKKLDSYGIKPTSLEVSTGNEKFIILKADYETPKGLTSFYIPSEIQNNKVVLASLFMGNTGIKDLNHVNIKNYITSNAGSKLKVGGSNILSMLVTASDESREISNAELALTKLNAKKNSSSEFSQNQIVGQKVAEAAKKDIEIPKAKGFESFSAQFATPEGLASFKFGDKVATAKDSLVRDLIGFGNNNPKVVVLANNDNTIFYGVSLDSGKVAFTVPVKVTEGKISKPSTLICNGAINTFEKRTIDSLYLNKEVDHKVASAASPLFGSKPSELINDVREAMLEGNKAKAEDALNVLANSGDIRAYATGFQIYLQSLGGNVENNECKCKMVIKNSSSKHPICGHTGLPTHKVYQDKDGNCRPLYRRGMDETYEGASFMNSKIFG